MLASHLGMSLQRVQVETTAREFGLWMTFLGQQKEQEFKNQDKSDLHNAVLACEIRRSWVKHPNKVQVTDFIIDRQDKKKVVYTKEQKMQMAKQTAFDILGTPEGAM